MHRHPKLPSPLFPSYHPCFWACASARPTICTAGPHPYAHPCPHPTSSAFSPGSLSSPCICRYPNPNPGTLSLTQVPLFDAEVRAPPGLRAMGSAMFEGGAKG